MTKTPEIRMNADARKMLNKLGFSYAVIVARDVSVRLPGSVEAVFRNRNDASRFKTGLCKMYGQYTYEVVSL